VLPETVLAMIETRLGRLAVEARRVLRAASVFGEVCWEGGVVMLLTGAMSATVVGELAHHAGGAGGAAVRPAGRFPASASSRSATRCFARGLCDVDRRRSAGSDTGSRGEWLEQHGEGDPWCWPGTSSGRDAPRAASYYLRASEQAFHILDLDATMTRAGLGLGCAPPPELRIALLGMRCEASGYGLQAIDVTMADAEELMRSAPRGSIPWAQG